MGSEMCIRDREGILQSVDEGCRYLGYVADVVDNRGLPIAQADVAELESLPGAAS